MLQSLAGGAYACCATLQFNVLEVFMHKIHPWQLWVLGLNPELPV